MGPPIRGAATVSAGARRDEADRGREPPREAARPARGYTRAYPRRGAREEPGRERDAPCARRVRGGAGYLGRGALVRERGAAGREPRCGDACETLRGAVSL